MIKYFVPCLLLAFSSCIYMNDLVHTQAQEHTTEMGPNGGSSVPPRILSPTISVPNPLENIGPKAAETIAPNILGYYEKD